MEFVKNQSKGMSGRSGKGTGFDDEQMPGLLERSGCRSLYFGLKRTEVPLAKPLRAIADTDSLSTLTAAILPFQL